MYAVIYMPYSAGSQYTLYDGPIYGMLIFTANSEGPDQLPLPVSNLCFILATRFPYVMQGSIG